VTALLTLAADTITVPSWLVTVMLAVLTGLLGFVAAWGAQRQAIKALTEQVKSLADEVAQLRNEFHKVDKAVAIVETTERVRHDSGKHQTITEVQAAAMMIEPRKP
jgi:Tfp pilus assembly protein PilN